MKLFPYRLILPAIWLNTVFGNQVWYPSIGWLGQVFYWLSLIAVILLVLRAFGTQVWPYAVLTVFVVSRLASLGGMPGARFLYFGSVFVLFVAAGVLLAIHAPEILERQSRIFFFLSVPVMVLQVAGVAEWLHAFNTLYAVTDPNGDVVRPTIRMLPLLFTSPEELMSTRMSDFEEFVNWQGRPPGLTHSSAFLSIFILAGAALHFGRMKGKRITRYDCIFVSVVVVSGSKLALLGFVLIAFWSYLRSDATLRRRLRRVAGMLATVFLVFAMVFPVPIKQNLATGSFEVSFFIRAVDTLLKIAPETVLEVPAVLDVINTYPVSFSDETNVGKGSLSGIATLLFALPFLSIAALLALPWIVRGVRHCRTVFPETARTAELMALAVFLAPFATSIFASQFYALCVGIAFMPIANGFSARLRQRLLRSAHLRAHGKGITSGF